MVDTAQLETLLRAMLPITGDRSVRLGTGVPLVRVEDNRIAIALDLADVDSYLSPAHVGPGCDAVVAAWLAAVQRVTTASAGHWCFAALDTRMPPDLAVGESHDELVARFLKPQWLGGLLPVAEQTPYAFEPAPASIAYTDDGSIDAANIQFWCTTQLDYELERPAPEPARTLARLAGFAGLVHNGGLAGFLLQRPSAEIIAVYTDLTLLGSRKLAERLAAGIPSARRSAAEFTRSKVTWPEAMTAVTPCTLDELDGHDYPGSWHLLERELGPARNRFVRKHLDVLAAVTRSQ